MQTLQARIADAQAKVESLQYRDERADARESPRRDQALLARWEQIQPLQAAGMCPECGQSALHTLGTTYSLDDLRVTGGPCPA